VVARVVGDDASEDDAVSNLSDETRGGGKK
jgi:hypothetical protein